MPVQTSIQLFTVREALEADLDRTLAELASRGFTAAEPYDFVRRAETLATSLKTNGIAAPTGHAFLASTSFVNPDGSGTSVPVPSPAAVFDAAGVLGMTTVIDPYTEPSRWQSIEQIAEIARSLNIAAEIGAERGIRVGYHNHAHRRSRSRSRVTSRASPTWPATSRAAGTSTDLRAELHPVSGRARRLRPTVRRG